MESVKPRNKGKGECIRIKYFVVCKERKRGKFSFMMHPRASTFSLLGFTDFMESIKFEIA
jgi:hypothetical protein